MSAVLHIKPEKGIPIPDSDFSGISMLERARLACNTVHALHPDAPDPDELTDEEVEATRTAFSALTGLDKNTSPPDVTSYPTQSLRYLDSMLSQYDQELVNSAVRIREYVKNKLLEETESPDGRIRIRALELLGKMKDVGLFTDRVEVTYKTKSDEELVAEINKRLEKFMGPAQLVDADADSALRLEQDPEEPENLSDFLASTVDGPE